MKKNTRLYTQFQSTPPWEGATPHLKTFPIQAIVSIHAPVGGGDCHCLNLL